MPSANLTRRALSLTSQDTVTGWYGKTFAVSTIRGVIQPRGASVLSLPIGNYARYEYTLFTEDTVLVGDEILDSNSTYYTVKAVNEWWWLDEFSHYTCELAVREFEDQPTSSGTWHLDSDSARTDVRYATRLWFGTYVTGTNLKLDNGTTNAAYITCFSNPPYPLSKVFDEDVKDRDLVFTFGKGDCQQLGTRKHKPYAFLETAQVTAWAVNKSGLTAANLVEQAEQEIRRVTTDYPFVEGTSVRSIQSMAHEPVRMGGSILENTMVEVKYKRYNDDYDGSGVNFTHSMGFTYEGDRLSGGAEGTWDTTNHKGGSTITFTNDSERNLDLNCTVYVGDAYTHNGTSLGLNTSTYTTMIVRYKTTSNAFARVDTDDETVMSERQSSTWKTESFTLTGGNTLDEVRLYLCDGTGHVYYDFVQICGGTYTLPNVVNINQPLLSTDALLKVPHRAGVLAQPLGTGSLEISMTCDLDMEPQSLTWKRPQASTPKTDVNNADILYEQAHLGGSNIQNLWCWLDLGDPAMQFKARLVEVAPEYSMDEGLVRLKWREYRHGTASSESTSERFGFSL